MAKQHPVFVRHHTILSPMGLGTAAHYEAIAGGESGVRRYEELFGLKGPFFLSLLKDDQLRRFADPDLSRFERMLLTVLEDLQQQSDIDFQAADTGLIIASAKGNIADLDAGDLPEAKRERISLHGSAKRVAAALGLSIRPWVVSHACISGLLAIVQARMLLQSGVYKHIVVAAADEISSFILSGFNSLQALAEGPCRPFDQDRKGINLGEGAAAMILSVEAPRSGPVVSLRSGAVTNDANHISGPSRSGEELAMAMRKSIREAKLEPADIDMISLHGTATLYNDEMEAKALSVMGLQDKPCNSLKGNFGHTLGAAGLIEAAICMESLGRNQVLPTLGFNRIGVPSPVHIVTQPLQTQLTHCLKTASGFGGCNAAVVFSKEA